MADFSTFTQLIAQAFPYLTPSEAVGLASELIGTSVIVDDQSLTYEQIFSNTMVAPAHINGAANVYYYGKVPLNQSTLQPEYVGSITAAEAYAESSNEQYATLEQTPLGSEIEALSANGVFDQASSTIDQFFSENGITVPTNTYPPTDSLVNAFWRGGAERYASQGTVSSEGFDPVYIGPDPAPGSSVVLNEAPNITTGLNGLSAEQVLVMSPSELLMTASQNPVVDLGVLEFNPNANTQAVEFQYGTNLSGDIPVSDVLASTPNIDPTIANQAIAIDPNSIGVNAEGGEFPIPVGSALTDTLGVVGNVAGSVGEALVFSDIIGSANTAIDQVQNGDTTGATYTMATLTGRVEAGLYGAESLGEAGAELGSLFGPVGAAAGGLVGGVAGGIAGYELGQDGVAAIWNDVSSAIQGIKSAWTGEGDSDVPTNVTTNTDGSSQITNSLDGSSVTLKFEDPDGSGSLNDVDSENADGTSQLIAYDPDGSSVSSDYTGPEGTGTLTEIDQENLDDTSEITTFDSDGTPTTIDFTGPNGTGDGEGGGSTDTIGSGSSASTASFMNTILYFPTYRVGDLGETTLETTVTASEASAGNYIELTLPPLPGTPFDVSTLSPTTIGNGQNLTIYVGAHALIGGEDYAGYQAPIEVQYFSSNGTITSQTGQTTQYLTLNEKVYERAGVQLSLNGSSSFNINLGAYHVGDPAAANVVVTNDAPAGFADVLSGGLVDASSAPFSSSSSVVGLEQGQSTSLDIDVDTNASGTFQGGDFNFISHDNDLPDVAPLTMDDEGTPYDSLFTPTSFSLQATVYAYAVPTFTVSGLMKNNLIQSGDNWSLDLGNIAYQDPNASTLDETGISIENNLSFFEVGDSLEGSINVSGTGFIQSNVQSLNTRAAFPGFSMAIESLTPDASQPGVHTETFVFHPTSFDSGGLSSTLPDITLTVSDDVVGCYLLGARIATPRGEIVVEELAVGESVQAQFAGLARVEWIGRRQINCHRHPKPQQVWPVRVCAGAFGENLPHRELWLSPDHAVFVDDVLIPIKYLVNGSTVEQVPTDDVTYYHVELPEHDVLLAEGLPTESYLDAGDRSKFANGGGSAVLHPDFSARMWEGKGCAPLIVTGPKLQAVRQRLNDRAKLIGVPPPSGIHERPRKQAA